MNKDGVLTLLEEYLGTFRYHANLFREIADIVAKSGYERSFFTLLVMQLRILAVQGKDAIRFSRIRTLKAFTRRALQHASGWAGF